MIKVTIWNEFRHEVAQDRWGERCREHYPNGIHIALKQNLASEDLLIRTATLADPEQGLPDELLNDTDVLMWWGHVAHKEVSDALVDKIQNRVLGGMGLVVLHSGHKSKIFQRMTGCSCALHWREAGESERVWTIDPAHPICKGVPPYFVVERTEMYGEPFGIPEDAKPIFISWYQGGDVFRSGVTLQRGLGKIFYFSPGHETFPIYHDPNVLKVLSNAIRWAAPVMSIMADPLSCPNAVESPEPLPPYVF